MIQSSNFEDEEYMNYCLEVNDDLVKTMDRFESLKKGRKPFTFRKGKGF